MESAGIDKAKVGTVLNAVLKACEQVAVAIRDIDCSVGVQQANAFGDNQLHIDVLSDKHIFDELKATKLVAWALSEETPEPQDCGGSEYIVTFDPLDGSSIVDCNWTVGTIFAIWPNKDKLQGLDGHSIITAGIVCYGPRTTVVYYDLEESCVSEFKLHLGDDKVESKWVKMKTKLSIGPKTKIFAPGNFRACGDSKPYIALLDYWRSSKYVLRYIGGMAPDCYAMFVKSGGIFCALDSKGSPAKLRLLYECHPIAFVVEKAGGLSTDGKNNSILDIKVSGFQQKTPFCCGSSEEIERIKKVVAECEAKERDEVEAKGISSPRA